MPAYDLSTIPGLAFWFEPRKGGMFQDSAGTVTPATANDDPVGYLPDLSGNGFHATETTGTTTRRPLLKTAGFASMPCIRFDGVNDILQLGNPVALRGASRSGWTATYCLSIVSATSYGTILARGIEDYDVWDWIGTNVLAGPAQPLSLNHNFRFSTSSNANIGTLTTATRYVLTHRVSPFRMHEFFINGQLISRMPLSNATPGADWAIGARGDPAFFASMDLAGMTFFGRSLSDAELSQVQSYFASWFDVTMTSSPLRTINEARNGRVHVIYDGNSIVSGYRGIAPFVAQAFPLINYDHSCYLLSYDGKTTAQCTSGVPTSLRSVLERQKLNIVCLFEITNELGAGTSAATCYSNVLAYCNAVKALDPNVRIIVMTPVARNFLANQVAYEANRQTVMTSLRTAVSPPWDFLLDTGNSGTINVFGQSFDMSLVGGPSAYSSTTYFNDGVHLNRGGNAIVAPAVAAAINGVAKQYLEPYATLRNNQNAILGMI